jgi:chromosome segregation ATPase
LLVTDEKTIAFLRELERADEAVAATLAELDELAVGADRLRSRALQLETVLERLPTERERLARELREAERAADEADVVLAEAERELTDAEASGDDERVRAARRNDVRARDALRMRERRVAEIRSEQTALEREADEAAREIPELEERARELAETLAARPRLAADAGVVPAPGLAGVADWGSRARAALFVARGTLAAERDALIRQANELGSVVLGEPVTASSTSAIARRIGR